MERTTRRATLALSAALALAAPLVVAGSAHAADTDRPTPAVAAPDTVSAMVAAAARQAQREVATNRTLARGANAPTGAALDAALDDLVADGAIAVTARVEKGTRTWSGAAGTREREGRE